jgi:urease accessory protein
MLTANKLMPAGRGLAPVLLKRASTVRLDWDTRQKSRFEATDSLGRTLGVFLPRGSVVETCWWPKTAHWCGWMPPPSP